MADAEKSRSLSAPKAPAVIVVSDDAEIREQLIPALQRCGLRPLVVSSLREIQTALEQKEIALAFCTNKLPDGSFREVLHMFELAGTRFPVVIASRRGDCEEYLEAMRLGAFDYVATPYHFPEVRRVVKSVLRDHTMDEDRPEATPPQAAAAANGRR